MKASEKYMDGGKRCDVFLCPSLRPSGIHIPLTNCMLRGLWAGVVFGGHLFSSVSYQLHYSSHLRHSDLSKYQNFIVL